MTDTQAKTYLSSLLARGQAVNMIQVYRSRTGRKRGYRLFATNHLQRVQDVTSEVCKAIGHQWNNERGTYDTNEQSWNGADDDAICLFNRLHDALGFSAPVLTL